MIKNREEDLAIFGGDPAFDRKLHVGRPNVGDREELLGRINEVLDRGWLTNNGPNVQEFEKRVADLLEVEHCVAVCNATVGLEIATKAAGLSGEVIVPSWTFIATAHVLQWQGITPVFCDVDPATHNLDPRRVEEAITPRTTAILGVHLWGRPCDVEALSEIADRHNLKLMFDAAHAFGCSHGGGMVGGFGDAEVFSFHATKFFNTLEGGAVTTNDEGLATEIRLMRNFGFEGYDKVSRVGTNGKMNELSAAMGLTSFGSMDGFVETNRRNHQTYRQALRDVPGVRVLAYDEAERSNYQYVVLEVDSSVTDLDRDGLIRVLWAENVNARRYFYPGCHRMEPYRTHHPAPDLPATDMLAEKVISLPTGTAVGTDEIATICGIFNTAISQSQGVRKRLSDSGSAASG